MANHQRTGTAIAIARGVAAAVGVTLLGVLILSAAIVWAGLSDSALLMLNQVLKLVSIFIGAWSTVGRGGRRGFALGCAVGLVYMVLGYGIYCVFDGIMASPATMAAEFAIGAFVGAVSGTLMANLRPRRRTAHA